MNLVSNAKQMEIFRKHFPVEFLDIEGKKIERMFSEYEGEFKDKTSREYLIEKCKIIEKELMETPNTPYKMSDLWLITGEILRK